MSMNVEVEVTGRMVERKSTAEVDWGAVFTEQLPRIYNYFRYRLGHETDVQDLTSRTFEKAWRARHRYRPELASVGTWLLSIAHNVGVDHLRLLRNHAALDAAATAATENGTESQQEQISDQARMQTLLAILPLRERELLALKYGAGATNREIA